ncbi:carbohydrate kinase family protein [Roseinatronobacter monicus]|uniref:Fructokinase n=1 Tax=Roseinatronobacter monicus TaxID=393481 RepID=A0A543K3K2_9RHOB|nr:carbohydrate kinase [Roseinatronobacter monicus]TQM89661.1 fructokinase [Roseinatronobacter monicus]
MILCCGEALIDMLPIETPSRRSGFAPHSGGAVFNTAIALGRLGIKTGMLTGLSRDMFGQQLSADLKASHVDISHVIKSDRQTTLAFVQLVKGQAKYAFFDENSAGRMIMQDELPPIGESVSTVFFGGISLASEPGADTYAALAERVCEDSVIMLDPNIRSGFIRDEKAYRARLARMVRVADIVKLSDEDLDWLQPGPEPLAGKILNIQAAGPSVVIVTFGDSGASAWLSDGLEVKVPTPKVSVVDTVGAGDTFNAGVLAQLSNFGLLKKKSIACMPSAPMAEALAFGTIVAGVTVSRSGANPPWWHELENFDK